jgi:protoheme IX farnesyltransferase
MAVLAKNLWSLFKLRISLAIMLCALAGIAVAPGPALAGWQMALLGFAVLLSAASAGAFNHYVECDLDARMPRTRDRPFVTGYFHRGPVWLSVILGLLAAAVLLAGLATNWAAAGYASSIRSGSSAGPGSTSCWAALPAASRCWPGRPPSTRPCRRRR